MGARLIDRHFAELQKDKERLDKAKYLLRDEHAQIEFGNLSYENGGRGISIFESNNVDVVNNTTFHNGKDPTVRSRSELTAGNASNVNFFNNIAYGRGSNEEKYLTATYNASNIVWENNLLYNGVIYFDKNASISKPDGTNLIEIDPQFMMSAVAASASLATEKPENFHLQSHSPARGAGIPLGASMNSLDGSVVSANVPPNIGAY